MSGVFLWAGAELIPARRTDRAPRVLQFIDGQNVHKTCKDLFGYGFCHPSLLAERLLVGRRLVGVRYYSGIHDPRANPSLNAVVRRRHNLIQKTGVTVVERLLRYRWEWGVDQRDLPDPKHSRGEVLTLEASPYKRPREKGIDLALALDVVDLALQGMMDVAVIISSDNDLVEVARVVHDMTRRQGNRVSVEAALFNEGPHPILLPHYDFTHQLRRADFEQAIDRFDYRKTLDRTMVELFLRTLGKRTD
jgi:uncharacterized LabA/DUF88 family protein